jgi:hypothetical protein
LNDASDGDKAEIGEDELESVFGRGAKACALQRNHNVPANDA